MNLKKTLLSILIFPIILFAQSKKEEIVILNNRIDSIRNASNLEKSSLQKELFILKEDFANEKGLIQIELNETQKQLESVMKSFHNEKERNTLLQLKKSNDSLNLNLEIKKLKEVNEFITNSLRILQESQVNVKKNQFLNGTYFNSKNQIFTISNHMNDQEFEFSFKYGVNDEWECMRESEGMAMRMTKSTEEPGIVIYYVGELDYPNLTFTFSNGTNLQLWADSQWLGMDCSKFGDSQEEMYTKFIKK